MTLIVFRLRILDEFLCLFYYTLKSVGISVITFLFFFFSISFLIRNAFTHYNDYLRYFYKIALKKKIKRFGVRYFVVTFEFENV